MDRGKYKLCLYFVDKETKKVYTNRKEYQDYNSVKENISDIQKNAKYMIVQPKLSDFKTNMDITANDWKEFVSHSAETATVILFLQRQ